MLAAARLHALLVGVQLRELGVQALSFSSLVVDVLS